jgi:hypothetical protein
MEDASAPSGSPAKETVCKTCDAKDCAKLKLKMNRQLTMHEAYSKIGSGQSGKGPSLFQSGTTRTYNAQDKAAFGALTQENHAAMKANLEEYKKKGCDPKDVLEHRKAVHNYKPPISDGVMGAGKWAAGKGSEYMINKVPLVGEAAGDLLGGINEIYEQNAVPF